MHQEDFSLLQKMNIHSDMIIANQGDTNSDVIISHDDHTARMISTKTRGVGRNRNIALMYADADICLLADDDITYVDDLEQLVTGEFKDHPDADVMIFHLKSTDKIRSVKKPKRTRRLHRFSRLPWGGAHVAFRLSAVKKANLWFTTLFGGGCIFPSGEDSIWMLEARRKGLVFYSSSVTIGTVDMGSSSWYSGADEKYYYGKGAFYEYLKKKPMSVWMIYFAYRTENRTKLPVSDRIKWMKNGRKGFRQLMTYEEFTGKMKKRMKEK